MSQKSVFDIVKTLLKTCREAGEMEPWTFMGEDEVFVVPGTDGETYYCCVLGTAGISRDIVFYRGERGWRAFNLIREELLEGMDALQEIDALAMGFEPWKQVDPDSKKWLKKMGLGPGMSLLPSSRSYLPGRNPVFPKGEEAEILTGLLELSLPVFRKSEVEPGWLLEKRGHKIFHVEPGGSPEKPVGKWRPPPEVQYNPPEAGPPDELKLARLARLDLRIGSAWEIEMGDSGASVRAEAGSFRPMVAVFADEESGFVVGQAMASGDEMPEALPRELLSAMEKHGLRPQAFHVRRKQIADWITSTSEKLGIPVYFKEDLSQVDEALNSLRAYMAGRPPRR